jgi:hypothetical protein
MLEDRSLSPGFQEAVPRFRFRTGRRDDFQPGKRRVGDGLVSCWLFRGKENFAGAVIVGQKGGTHQALLLVCLSSVLAQTRRVTVFR